MPICIEICSFVFKIQCSIVGITDGRKKRRTDKWSSGEHYGSGLSRLMFVDGIAFVSFYAAEHVLSAIAKFLVYLLAEGETRGPRRGWEGRVGEERGKKRASVSRGGK